MVLHSKTPRETETLIHPEIPTNVVVELEKQNVCTKKLPRTVTQVYLFLIVEAITLVLK